MADLIQTPGLDTKKTFEQLMGVQRPYLERTAKAREDVSGAEADIARAQQAQAEAKATAMVEPTQKYVSDVQSAQQAYQQKKEAEPIPAFVPTRDSAEDLAKLFSFIGVMGTFVGRGAGKQASMGAMSAMTGMMNGWQQGRTDLYNQEKVKFEKDFNRVQKLHQDLAKDLETAVKTAATNKELGVRLAEEAAIRSGSDIVAAQVKKGNLVAALETSKEMASAAQKVGAQVEKLLEADIRARSSVEAAAARATGKTPAKGPTQFSRDPKTGNIVAISGNGIQVIENSADIPLPSETRAEEKASKDGGKPPPKDIINQNSLRNNLIPKIEEAIPVLDRLNKEGNWEKMTVALAADPRIAEALFKDDPEALNLVLTLAYFRSKEFETAGKALTKKEDQILAPIVRGDLRVYQGIRNAMLVGLSTLKDEQRGLEAVYPYIKSYNQALRGEQGDQPAPNAPAQPARRPAPVAKPQGSGTRENPIKLD
jgi:hypothetical protein